MAPQPGHRPGPTPRDRKRAKLQNARQIATQSTLHAFGSVGVDAPAGALDVHSFVRSHAFQVDAIRRSIQAAKRGLASRAFQEVPRSMRRRTASHDVRRVPSRLRARAGREMVEDNTTTANNKNGGAQGPDEGAKARARKEGKKRRRRRLREMLREQAQKHRERDQSRTSTTRDPPAASASGGGGDDDDDDDDASMADAANTASIYLAPPSNLMADIEPQNTPTDDTDTPAQQAPPRNRPAPAKKSKLAFPPETTGKFRSRQQNKTWLPTHLFHAKRSRMTSPDEPLWGFAMPQTPTEKCVRATIRATDPDLSSKGALAWDSSYIATIQLQGAPIILQSLFRHLRVGFESDVSKNLKLLPVADWLKGNVAWHGWLPGSRRDCTLIAPVSIIWCPLGYPETVSEKSRDKLERDYYARQPGHFPADSEVYSENPPYAARVQQLAWLRVHPAAFLDVWKAVQAKIESERIPVKIEDVRYQLGSISLAGPNSLEAIAKVLRWRNTPMGNCESNNPIETLFQMLSLGCPSSASLLGPNVVLSSSAIDPRLHIPSREKNKPVELPDETTVGKVLQKVLLNILPRSIDIFNPSNRARGPLSDKVINSRRRQALPGGPTPVQPDDPPFPFLIYGAGDDSVCSGVAWDYTVILPWKMVDVVFRSLVQLRVGGRGATGEPVRWGGIDEERLVCSTLKRGWFPADFPGTPAGFNWAAVQAGRRLDEWSRRPPGKRTSWETVRLAPTDPPGEIGAGWAMDWDVFTIRGQLGRLLFADAHLRGFPALVEALYEFDSRKADFLKSARAEVLQLHADESLSRAQVHDAVREREGRFWAELRLKHEASWLGAAETKVGMMLPHEWRSLGSGSDGSSKRYKPTTVARDPDALCPPFNLLTRVFADTEGAPWSAPPIGIAPVAFTMMGKGNPAEADRIYKIPTTGPSRRPWLELFAQLSGRKEGSQAYQDRLFLSSWKDYGSISAERPGKIRGQVIEGKYDAGWSETPEPPARRPGQTPPDQLPVSIRDRPMLFPGRTEAASELLSDADLAERGLLRHAGALHPAVPSQEWLVGFVSSGGFSPREGKGVGVGSVWLEGLMFKLEQDPMSNVFIVRPAGSPIARLAVWSVL